MDGRKEKRGKVEGLLQRFGFPCFQMKMFPPLRDLFFTIRELFYTALQTKQRKMMANGKIIFQKTFNTKPNTP